MNDMPLRFQQRVSSREYQETFNATDPPHPRQTLLCFELEKRNGNRDDNIRGCVYNTSDEHAEICAFKIVQEHVDLPNTNGRSKFKVSFYISYSPCYNCCEKISQSISDHGNTVEWDIKYAQPYKAYDATTRSRLEKLVLSGAIKQMDPEDHERCRRLFVDPDDSSTTEVLGSEVPSGADVQDDQRRDDDESHSNIPASSIQQSEENNSSEPYVCETNADPSGYVTSDTAEITPLRNADSMPQAREEGDSEPETPETSSANESAEPTRGVKRKLSFPDN